MTSLPVSGMRFTTLRQFARAQELVAGRLPWTFSRSSQKKALKSRFEMLNQIIAIFFMIQREVFEEMVSASVADVVAFSAAMNSCEKGSQWMAALHLFGQLLCLEDTKINQIS